MTWGAAAWSSHLAAEAERRHWWRGGGEAEQSKLGRVVIISESGSTLWVSGWWFGTCFSSIVGMMIQSDFYIFRGGWNHQLIRCIMGNSVYIDLHWYHDWLNYIYYPGSTMYCMDFLVSWTDHTGIIMIIMWMQWGFELRTTLSPPVQRGHTVYKQKIGHWLNECAVNF